MALPWLAAVATLYVVFRWFFAGDLRVQPHPGATRAGAAAAGVRVWWSWG